MTNTSPGRLRPRIHSGYGNFLLTYLPLTARSRTTIIYDLSTCSPLITRRWQWLVNSGQVLVNGGTWVVFEETVLVSQKIFFTDARWTYQCLVHSTTARFPQHNPIPMTTTFATITNNEEYKNG